MLKPVHLVQEIAKDIMEQQTPKQVYVVRCKLYELLVNCLPPEVILGRLSQELMSRLDDQLKHTCARHAASYEHRLQASHTPRRCYSCRASCSMELMTRMDRG